MPWGAGGVLPRSLLAVALAPYKSILPAARIFLAVAGVVVMGAWRLGAAAGPNASDEPGRDADCSACARISGTSERAALRMFVGALTSLECELASTVCRFISRSPPFL